MELAINIIKNLLLPKLEKDASFDINQADIAFWETFINALIDFEKNPIPVYTAIYSLDLADPEKIINKLENLQHSFLDQLAEENVLGYGSEIIIRLEQTNPYFNEKVQFYKNLEKAIILSERKRIKSELPGMFEKYSFEMDEKQLVQAITKRERQALRDKMKVWDEELLVENEEEKEITLNTQKQETKTISLVTYIKYAVAACFVLGFGLWFYNKQPQVILPENNIVTAPETVTPSKNIIITEIPTESLASISTVSKTTTVIESALGFASKEKKIKITENNQRARMQSIVIAIDKYRQFLEKELTENKVGDGPVVKEIESKIKALENELAILKERENHYVFDGKALEMYVSNSAKENTIVLYEDRYYLKRDADFYSLTIATQQQAYKKVIDSALVEVLYNLYFE